MRIRLKNKHFQALSEFSLDVAKGSTLAVVLGQIFTNQDNKYLNLTILIYTISISLTFLMFGLLLRKKL